MKKSYITPLAKIVYLESEDTILAYSNVTVGGKDVEEGDGSDASNRREGFFGGNMWDNM